MNDHAHLPQLGDAAMGTALGELGVNILSPIGSCLGLFEAPDMVQEIHLSHLQAGAQLITSNTFLAHRSSFQGTKWKGRHQDAIELGVALAHQAIREHGARSAIPIMGSIGPLRDPNGKAFRECAEHLIKAGVQGLLAETMYSKEQVFEVLQGCASFELPLHLGLVASSEDPACLLDGFPLSELVQIMDEKAARAELRFPDLILVNCTALPDCDAALSALRSGLLKHHREQTLLGCSPHLRKNVNAAKGMSSISPEDYAETMLHLQKKHNLALLAGCCASNSTHIAALAKSLSS